MAARVRSIGYLQLAARNGRRYEYGVIVEGQCVKTDVSSAGCEVRPERRSPRDPLYSRDKPPVEEPPNAPKKAPVKEPPPADPDREPPQKPPVRALPAEVKDKR